MAQVRVEQIVDAIIQSKRLAVSNNQFFLQGKGYYERVEIADAAKFVRRLFCNEQQKQISTSAINEALMRFSQLTETEIQFIDNREWLLNVENGVLNLDTGELMNREAMGPFLHKLNFRYICKQSREMTVFEEFVREIFPEQTEEHRQLLMEIIGYCISGYTKAKAGFFLIGKTGSGKTTILELVKAVVPESQRTSLSIAKLGSRFNLAKLYGSRINFCSELSEDAFHSEDVFKEITSNEIVTAEFKGQTPFQFRVKTKLLNAGNFLPSIQVSEGSQALIDRLIILNFPVTIPRQQQNPYLLDELLKEKDSIFSEAADAVMDLQKNLFQFIEPVDTHKLKVNLETQNRLFDDFFRDCCEYAEGSKVHIQDLWQAFCTYADDNLIDNHFTKQQFSTATAMLNGVKRQKFRLYGSSAKWGLIGIQLRYDNLQDSETSDVSVSD